MVGLPKIKNCKIILYHPGGDFRVQMQLIKDLVLQGEAASIKGWY